MLNAVFLLLPAIINLLVQKMTNSNISVAVTGVVIREAEGVYIYLIQIQSVLKLV